LPEPMYRRIAEDLRQEIESGTLAPGSQLPTEIELRDKYVASRNTVRDAVKWLTSRGLVETRPGHGTFVIERFVPFVTTLSGEWQTDVDSCLGGGEGQAAYKEAEARYREWRASTPKVEIQQASGNVASRLRVPEGTTVISRHQERYIDEKPWSLQTTYYPMALAEGARRLLESRDIVEGTVKYLKEALGMMQVGYRDRILVRPPDENEVKFFRLPDDGRISVLVLLRTGFAESPDGPIPFRLTETVFPSDRNQFVVNAGEVPDRLASAAEA
jgi:GntR family transcriptional regulator